jgi:hypothetical protein
MAKFIVSFKDPDTVGYCTREAKLSPADQKKADRIAKKFFEYGEYAHIEIDTDKGTATLIPVPKE